MRVKKKTRVTKFVLPLFLTLFAFIVDTNQVKFLIMEYNILESSPASFKIVSSSDIDIMLSSLRMSRIATHSNKEALAIVK